MTRISAPPRRSQPGGSGRIQSNPLSRIILCGDPRRLTLSHLETSDALASMARFIVFVVTLIPY